MPKKKDNTDTPYREEGARLAQVLKATKYRTKTEFAEAVNVNLSDVSKYVSGKNCIPQHVLIFLHEKHHVRFEYMLLGEGRMVLGQQERQHGAIDVKKLYNLVQADSVERAWYRRKILKLFNELEELKSKINEASY